MLMPEGSPGALTTCLIASFWCVGEEASSSSDMDKHACWAGIVQEHSMWCQCLVHVMSLPVPGAKHVTANTWSTARGCQHLVHSVLLPILGAQHARPLK